MDRWKLWHVLCTVKTVSKIVRQSLWSVIDIVTLDSRYDRQQAFWLKRLLIEITLQKRASVIERKKRRGLHLYVCSSKCELYRLLWRARERNMHCRETFIKKKKIWDILLFPLGAMATHIHQCFVVAKKRERELEWEREDETGRKRKCVYQKRCCKTADEALGKPICWGLKMGWKCW